MADEPTAVLETPVVTPAAEPVAAVTPAAEPVVTPEPKLTGEDALRARVGQVMDKTKGFEITKPAEVKPVVEPAKVEPVKAEEPKPGEAKVEDVKPTAEVLPPNLEALTKVLNDNPEVAAKLEEALPGITETLGDSMRKAAVVDEYIATGLVTPELAQVAAEDAQKFYGIEEAFPKVNSPEALDKFVMDVMLPLSFIRDDAGNPLKNPDGTFQTDGSTARFFSNWNAFDAITTLQGLDRQIADAKKMGGEAGENLGAELERIKEAQILVQNYRDAGYQLPKTKDPDYKRSPEDQALIDKANNDRQEAARATAEASKTAESAYVDGVLTESMTATGAYLAAALNKTSLSDTEKSLVAEKIQDQTWEAMGKNGHFQRQKGNLYAQGNKPEVKARLISLVKTTFEQLSRKPFQELVAKYGGKQVAASTARQQKIDAQVDKDRMNQGGGTTPGAIPPATMSASDTRNEAIKQLKAEGNKYPSDEEILTKSMSLRKMKIA